MGKWYCVEAHTKLNDSGFSNGVFELWIDDGVEARLDRLKWQGPHTEYGTNMVFLENYRGTGSPQPRERYFNDFVVSAKRIRMLAS